jgi:hypothetical protein
LMPLGLDGPAFYVMGEGLEAMIAIAEWFSARSPIDAVGAIPVGAVVVLTLALVLATLCTTWLRLAVLPILAAGLIWIGYRETPDALISEDGRLVALRLSDGRLAVNRRRPNAFTVENWQRILRSIEVLQPEEQAFTPGQTVPAEGETRFYCRDDLCLARHKSGAILGHAGNADAARPACATASLIVSDDATTENPCMDNNVVVVTKQDLARRGSAELHFSDDDEKVGTTVAFAVREPYRPWHAHRQFSREARGLPPYRRETKETEASSGGQ